MNAETRFAEAMRSHGITPPPEIVADGRIHRFPLDGERGGKRSGAYRLYGDGRPAGWFQSHKGGGGLVKWAAEGGAEPMTVEQWRAHRKEMLRRQAERAEETERQHKAAAQRAQEALREANGSPDGHPYAVKKRVPLGPHIRRGGWPQNGWTDALLVPLFDSAGKVWSVEAINGDGEKMYLSGGKKTGCFHPFGRIRGADRVLIGEGLATVAACVHATGLPAAAAMDCGNLRAVALAVRQIAPDAEIILLADNDIGTAGNPGVSKAKEAAGAVGGRVAIPELNGAKCDWWDVFAARGSEAVMEMLSAPLPTVAEVAAVAVAPPEESDGWGAPQSIIDHSAAPSEYPLDALPERIRAAVEEVQGFVQAPLPMVASSALAAVSLAVQAHCDVRRDEGLEGPSSLFFLIVAESGERKSSVDSHFTRAVREYQTRQGEAMKPDLDRYNAELAAWGAKRDGIIQKIKECAKSGQSSGSNEAALVDIEARQPSRPRVPRLLYADATPEALAHGLAFQWPSAGVVSSEAGTVLGGHAMRPDSAMRNLSLLNQLWDGAAVPIDRRSTESFTVQGARLTMALQVQEATLRAFFEQTKTLARGSGFMARFLIAWPTSTQGHRPYSQPPKQWPALSAFNRRIDAILSQPAPIDDQGRLSPQILDFSPEAKEAWERFYNTVEGELREGGELESIRDCASKIADNAGRLATLLHVFEGQTGPIGPEAIEAAGRIAAWHLLEARRFFGEIALPEDVADALRLDAWLVRHCRTTGAQVVDKNYVRRHGPNSLRKAERLAAAIRELIALDRLREEGERKRVLLVNPQLLERRNDH